MKILIQKTTGFFPVVEQIVRGQTCQTATGNSAKACNLQTMKVSFEDSTIIDYRASLKKWLIEVPFNLGLQIQEK